MRVIVHMTRLGIGLISVINATAALAAPNAFASGCAAALPAIQATRPCRAQMRVQRPPRVPRREQCVLGPSTAPTAVSHE